MVLSKRYACLFTILLISTGAHSYSFSTDSFGTTRDNNGNSCSTDSFGTTRCY